MSDQKHLLDKIEYLTSEVEQLKARVATLESKNSQEKLLVKNENITTPKTLTKGWDKVTGTSQEVESKFNKEGLESIIGGKLLNRVGIVVLLFGVAYFLKYSFDNKWIGELGRVVIGFLGGMSLLVAGDVVMRRSYRYFSQGLTGGGIGIIYLTTFAATNFYHLIGSGAAFALLVLTALTGGILSVRQNALGVAVLATLGGFLSPFLIGSNKANPVALLGYIAILDLAVLYLAYYKNWRSLNLLAFFGTALVYFSYQVTSYKTDLEILWLNQGFLILYFLVFGLLAFFYNVRHRQATKARDVLLLVLNAAFFFGASADILDTHYSNILGPFAILLAGIYLVVALGLHKKKLGDNLLFLSLLGTGLAFVTIAIPLQLNEDRIIASAWLVEAMALIYGGIRGGNIWVRRAGVVLLSLVTLTTSLDQPYFAKPPIPIFNIYSLAANLSVIGLFFVSHMFYHHPDLLPGERKKVWPSAIIGSILAIKQISWEVINAINYFNLDISVDFSVSLAWVAFAIFMMTLGLVKDIKGFRYISLALFGLTTLKVMLFDLSGLAMILRVLILIIVGAILLGVSFIYQRKEKRERE